MWFLKVCLKSTLLCFPLRDIQSMFLYMEKQHTQHVAEFCIDLKGFHQHLDNVESALTSIAPSIVQ